MITILYASAGERERICRAPREVLKSVGRSPETVDLRRAFRRG